MESWPLSGPARSSSVAIRHVLGAELHDDLFDVQRDSRIAPWTLGDEEHTSLVGEDCRDEPRLPVLAVRTAQAKHLLRVHTTSRRYGHDRKSIP